MLWGMTSKTRHGLRDDAAWLPAYRLSQAGWASARIAQIMDVTPRWAATRIRRIAKLSHEEREALREIALERIAREAEALAMLGLTTKAKAALARLDLAEKAGAKREAAQKTTPDASRPPQARREEGEYPSASTEERRAQLRERLERQAERFGFSEELEQALREGEAEAAAAQTPREDGEADPAEAPAAATAPAEPAPTPPAPLPSAPTPPAIPAPAPGYRRRAPAVAGPRVRCL